MRVSPGRQQVLTTYQRDVAASEYWAVASLWPIASFTSHFHRLIAHIIEEVDIEQED
jgi:hypothetical protein